MLKSLAHPVPSIPQFAFFYLTAYLREFPMPHVKTDLVLYDNLIVIHCMDLPELI